MYIGRSKQPLHKRRKSHHSDYNQKQDLPLRAGGGIGVILSKDRLSSSGNSSKDLNKLNITFIDHDEHTLDTTDIALLLFLFIGF